LQARNRQPGARARRRLAPRGRARIRQRELPRGVRSAAAPARHVLEQAGAQRAGHARMTWAGHGALSAAALALSITGCASLPSLEGRIETSSIAGTEATRLGRAIAPHAAANPGKAGVHPLHAPADAFAARILLARAAEKSLDVQYYIWHGDQTGYLLFEALWHAAGRGVRVRILLD